MWEIPLQFLLSVPTIEKIITKQMSKNLEKHVLYFYFIFSLKEPPIPTQRFLKLTTSHRPVNELPVELI